MSEDASDVPALSIGAVFGGRTTLVDVKPTILDWSRRIEAARTGIDAPLRLNLVFQVPGDHFAPDFAGLRTGRFSPSRRQLLVQAAVPETLRSDTDSYVSETLREAIRMVEAFGAEREYTAGRVAELWRILELAAT